MHRPARTPHSSWLTLFAVVGALLAADANAQNLISNPELDADASEWEFPFLGSWDGNDDADGCDHADPGSGSANAISLNVSGDTYSSVEPSVCVAVSPGETIHTGIAYRSPFPADVIPRFYELADCAGAVTTPGFGAGGSMAPSVDWTFYAESFVVPANTLSIGVGWIAFDDSGSDFQTWWDRAFLGRAERIFADDLENGTFCRWSATGGVE
jgi:hypothetical protein